MADHSSISYDWTRFWQPWEDERQALPATAYLREMDSEWDRRCTADLRTLDALDAVPCLILLGEPGIGKSRVVAPVKTALAQQAASLSSAQRDVRAFVLDARWSEDRAFKPKKEPKPKRKRSG